VTDHQRRVSGAAQVDLQPVDADVKRVVEMPAGGRSTTTVYRQGGVADELDGARGVVAGCLRNGPGLPRASASGGGGADHEVRVYRR
jgi:hypothetical protein